VPADLLSDLYGNKKGTKGSFGSYFASREAFSSLFCGRCPFFVTVVGDTRSEFNRHGGLKTRFIRPSGTRVLVIGLGIGSITRPRNSMRELKRWPNGIYRRGSSPGSRNGTAADSKRLNPSNRTRCSIRRWSCSTTLALRQGEPEERTAGANRMLSQARGTLTREWIQPAK
jgi:hypothetical protein